MLPATPIHPSLPHAHNKRSQSHTASASERRAVAEMPLPAFLAAAARLAVLLAAAVTAANAVSFARYRRRHLRRIPNPIDESADPVADFRALRPASAEDAAGPLLLFVPPLSTPVRLALVSAAPAWV